MTATAVFRFYRAALAPNTSQNIAEHSILMQSTQP